MDKKEFLSSRDFSMSLWKDSILSLYLVYIAAMEIMTIAVTAFAIDCEIEKSIIYK